MRELDNKQLITSDFVLVSGDVVSNISLQNILREHRERRVRDKDAIMTMMVREASASHPTRSHAEASVFVLDPSTQQCVYFQSATMHAAQHDDKRVAMETVLFESHRQLEFRNDLIDCQIDICSADVPALFTENFDYQDIRHDFVHGILTSDILGKTIFCSVQTSGYAARVRSLQVYDAISRDVMARWAFPMVLDTNFDEGETYTCSRGNIYREQSVVMDRLTKIGHNVCLGKGTRIGPNTCIKNAIIGRGCTIGANVKIDGAYIWDNVFIGDNCTIEKSVIAEKVFIHAGCQVLSGAVIGTGCKILEGSVVRANTKLTSIAAEEPDVRIGDFDAALVGEEGVGYPMEDLIESEDDEDTGGDLDSESRAMMHSLKFDLVKCMMDLGFSDDSLSEADGSGSESDDDSIGIMRPRTDSAMTSSTVEEDEVENRAFFNEAKQSLQRSFEENHSVDNALLELNTLRMAENVNYVQVRSALVTALLERMHEQVNDGNGAPSAVVNAVMKRWGELLQRVIFSPDEQVSTILSLQQICSDRLDLIRYFGLVLQAMYNFDVVDEDAINNWFESSYSRNGSAEFDRLRDKNGRQFVEWLAEADEDDEDEDEDDDEDYD